MDSSSAWWVERAGTRNAKEQEDHWEREPYDHSVLTVNRSGGKESACNAGDPGLIPGSGRSTGEGIGYPFQYSWASLVAQMVKNLPAMLETWVQSLGWYDPLEKGLTIHSSIFGLSLWLSWWRIHPQCWRPGFNPWVGKIPWRKERLPTPIFWPGEFHDCIVRGATKGPIRLNNLHFHNWNCLCAIAKIKWMTN